MKSIEIIDKYDVEDMIENALSEDRDNDLWCENNSLRMQIKDLQESMTILKSNVEQLKKIVGWYSGFDDNNFNIEVGYSHEQKIRELQYVVDSNKIWRD
jgi:hypothetical protein